MWEMTLNSIYRGEEKVADRGRAGECECARRGGGEIFVQGGTMRLLVPFSRSISFACPSRGIGGEQNLELMIDWNR